MTMRGGIPVVILALGLAACRQPAPDGGRGTGSPMPAGQPAQSATPLSKKEVLKLLLANCDVNLKVDPSCAGVGTEVADTTIGDYVSGLLVQQAQPGGRNWIEVGCEPQPGAAPIQFWKCSVVFHRIDGEERGGWGVTFLVQASTRTLVRDSFRCTGGG